jgi:hypothetical protein
MNEQLLQYLDNLRQQFEGFAHHPWIINILPIGWFGNVHSYQKSPLKIITVGLNPSDKEFREHNNQDFSSHLRFPSYNNTTQSLFHALNEYFQLESAYTFWFNSSYNRLLRSLNSSYYGDLLNTVIHTDIASPFATSPTWARLNNEERNLIIEHGLQNWHNLVNILSPNLILISVSRGWENYINFNPINHWQIIPNIPANTPLKIRQYQLNNEYISSVIFMVQGRKPFMRLPNFCKDNFQEIINPYLNA